MRSASILRRVVAGWILGSSTVASADAISFDADGDGAANGTVVVGALDLAPGNMLLQPISNSPTPTYQFSHQASLIGLIDVNGMPISSPGMNSLFEITVVSSVKLERIDPNGNVTAAEVQPANSFIEIWYDTTPDANSLAGTGYNDGTRIYLGSPSSTLDSLVSQAVAAAGGIPYDQFGANDYPGQTTTVTTGSYLLGSIADYQDPSFFVSPVTSVELTTGIDTPFDMTNPSASFAAMPGGVAPIPGSFVVGLPFQSDGALQFAVPEPGGTGALAMSAATLLFLGMRRAGTLFRN